MRIASKSPDQPRLYSYVVEHDTGDAPNPFFGYCTLCNCKYRESLDMPRNVVELAEIGHWVVGTGGANLTRSSGNGTIIYAMKVTDKMNLQEYFTSSEFACKKLGSKGNCRFGDNFERRTDFDKYERFVLISEHFYYFGRNAIKIPKKRFPNLEKRGRRFRSRFEDSYIADFVSWIENEIGKKPGKHSRPCWPLGGQGDNCPPCKPRNKRTAPIRPPCD
jgi:hypothetical protein